MKVPRFFLGAILLLWGWQHDLLLVGFCLGFIIEVIGFAALRYAFKTADFNKFIDISIVLLAGTVVAALSTEAEKAMYIIVKWFPVIFFPIIAAQQLSMKDAIDIQAFFLAGKKRLNMQVSEIKEIEVSFIYALICLLSSGMTHTHVQGFYMGLSIFFLWALWEIRPERSNIYIWFVCILSVLCLGYLSQQGIRRVRLKINRMIIAYYMDYYNADPFKTSSAIGDIGELKLSNRILLRVSLPDDHAKQPVLLQNATYNTFVISNWYSRAAFEPVMPQKEDTFWQIQPPAGQTKQMTIYSRLDKNKAVLNLPQGVSSIKQMKVGSCQKNAMQTIRIEEGPSLIKSLVRYTGGLPYDPLPDEKDLLVNRKEKEGIAAIVNQLDIVNKSQKEIVNVLRAYFSSQYTYSLDLKGKGAYSTPLQNFLQHTKAGHCELFATATALILRQANIPARYTTGFIVHEYSRLENRLVVRQRDAHSWVKVYLNGRWENLDTTPASSLQADIERSDPSIVTDFLSFLGFKLSQLRHETGAELMKAYGLWLVLPLVIILFVRLRKANTIKRVKMEDHSVKKDLMHSHEALFYRVEELMLKKGYPKYPHETYVVWFGRVEHCFEDTLVKDRFLNLILQYHTWRFSRHGLATQEREKFDADSSAIIDKIKLLA